MKCHFLAGIVVALLSAGPVVHAEPARPTADQVLWQSYEIGMFVHFSMNTWQDQEYDDLSTPLSEFNPERLDTDQWARVAQDMGAKYIVFVAKHVGGFCMWPTETTDYSVKSTPWRNGQGDVMADLADSCQRYGIRLGVYLSPADRKHGATVGGRCETPEAQARYAETYRRQLTELLSNYGDMVEVWFDGSLVIEVGDILEAHAPRAMVFQGPHATIRWVGNEDGYAPYPAWNSVPAIQAKSGVATAAHGDPDGEVWMPLENDARIRANWFWNSKNHITLKSVEQLMNMYYASVGRGAVLLLNHTPDRTGLIPEADAQRSKEFRQEVQRRFGRSLAETNGAGTEHEIRFESKTKVDHVIIMENIEFGERVRAYVLEGLVGETWQELDRGISVGYKRIDGFSPVELNAIRLRVTESSEVPVIRRFAVFHTGVEGENVEDDVHVWAPPESTFDQLQVDFWDDKRITAEGTTLSIALQAYCVEATQYEVAFEPNDGDLEGLAILGASLLFNGISAPEFVQIGEAPGTININITGLDPSITLQVRVQRKGPLQPGKILLRKRKPN